MEKKADLYLSSNTSDGEEIEQFLNDRGVEVAVHDVDKEPGARKRMIEATRGACGPPVVEIGHQIVCGFDADRLEETIKYELG